MLKVKEDVVLRFNAIGKLHFIGIRIIRSLYQKRFQCKKHYNAPSSPLFVAVDSSFRIDSNNFDLTEQGDINNEDNFIELEEAINKLLNDPKNTISVSIFLQANETSIHKISQNSGISRYYLKEQYNKGKQELKKYITHD